MTEPTQQDSPERSELLRRLADAPVPALVVDFPRGDLGGIPIAKCRVEVLRHAVIDDIRARVAAKMMKDGPTPAEVGRDVWLVLYGDACVRELIAASVTGCRAIEGSLTTYPRLFLTGSEIAEHLTPAETQQLLDAYNVAQVSRGVVDLPEESPSDAAPAS